MILTWALCLILGAEATTPRPIDIVPPALRALLEDQPSVLLHHQGYLKQLAGKPELAESETAWWHASSRPDLRDMATQFGEAIGNDPDAQAQLNAFYDQLIESPALRRSVENLFRTELVHAEENPALARAVQYLRANPDVAMRFLDNPMRVRPLPEALQTTYNQFVENPEWMASLREGLGEVLDRPSAHQTVLPWWKQLENLAPSSGQAGATLPAELYRHPQELWLWHLRNINLSRNKETRPWIRHWNRLIHRNPMLAAQYGPFITDLLREPERLRQHLADLQARQNDDTGTWPPKMKPPILPPVDTASPVEGMKRDIARPTIAKPVRPRRPSMDTPERPPRPEFPAFPSLGKQGPATRNLRPEFPTFPTIPKKGNEGDTP